MQVRYRKFVGIVFLGLGALNLVLALMLLQYRSVNISIILGPLMLLLGSLYLTRPYAYIEQNQFVMPAMLGPVRRTFPFSTDTDVKVENGKYYVRNGSNWKRVPIIRWMSDPADLQALDSRFKRA